MVEVQIQETVFKWGGSKSKSRVVGGCMVVLSGGCFLSVSLNGTERINRYLTHITHTQKPIIKKLAVVFVTTQNDNSHFLELFTFRLLSAITPTR